MPSMQSSSVQHALSLSLLSLDTVTRHCDVTVIVIVTKSLSLVTVLSLNDVSYSMVSVNGGRLSK